MAWKGFIDYFNSNGTISDSRGYPDLWYCDKSPYEESVADVSHNIGGIEICEPCNYISNVAYYHSMLRICDYPHWDLGNDFINSQKRSFASLAFGSAFMHGSHTSVGHQFDVNFISIVAYTAYQAAISGLGSDSIIINEISLTKRSKTGKESQDEIIQMAIDK